MKKVDGDQNDADLGTKHADDERMWDFLGDMGIGENDQDEVSYRSESVESRWLERLRVSRQCSEHAE